MIKGGEENSISRVIRAIVRKNGLEDKLLLAELREIWPELVGVKMAQSTEWMNWKDGKLTVKMSTSVGRNELFYLRENLKERINERFETAFVKEIQVI